MKTILSLLFAAMLIVSTAPKAHASLQTTGWLTAAQYQTYFDTHDFTGLVPIVVEANVFEGQLRFHAVFGATPHGVTDWAAHHGMTDAQFQQTNQHYLNLGFRLDQHQRYNEWGYLANQGIWLQ